MANQNISLNSKVANNPLFSSTPLPVPSPIASAPTTAPQAAPASSQPKVKAPQSIPPASPAPQGANLSQSLATPSGSGAYGSTKPAGAFVPNPIIDAYLRDNTIDASKKAKLTSDLDSGKVTEDTAVKILTNKYPQLTTAIGEPNLTPSGTGGNQPPDKPMNIGDYANAALDLNGKALDMINPLKYAAHAADAIAGTYEAAKSGVEQIGGGAQQFGSGVVESAKSLAQGQGNDKAAQDIGQGFTKAVGGALGTAFSPASGVMEGMSPGVKQVAKDVVNSPNAAIGNTVHAIVGHLRPDLSSDYIEQNIVAPLQQAANIGFIVAGPEMAKNPTVKAFIDKAVSKAGDVGAAIADKAAPVTNAISNVMDTGGKVDQALQTAKTAGKNIVDTIKGDTTANAESNFNSAVDQGIQRGVRPTVVGKATASTAAAYTENARKGVSAIIDQKPNLALTDAATGEKVIGQTPKNLQQFGEAIAQTKKAIYDKYSAMTKAAGEKGAVIDLKTVANELDKVASDTVLQDSNPSAAKYAAEKADILRNRGSYTPEQAEQAVKIYNDSLQNYYRNPTPDTFAKAHVDALVANHLRTGLDNVIDSADGTQYGDLKKQYGSLKAIEKDVNHRATVNSRQNMIPLGQGLADVASGAEVVHGILSGNPASMAAGIATKGIAAYIKMLNDPNKIVADMFKKGEEFKAKMPTPTSLDAPVDIIPKAHAAGLNEATPAANSLLDNLTSRQKEAFSKGTPEEQARALEYLKLKNDLETKDAYLSKQKAPSSNTNYTRATGLSAADQAIEAAAFEHITANEAQILSDYKAKNGNVVNTDNFRPLFKDQGYTGNNAAAVQEPSSHMAKLAYTDALKNKGDLVVATGGGSGAGKSSALKGLPEFLNSQTNSAAILDSNMSSLSSAVKKINEATAAGKKFVEYFVYRDPVDAFENGVIKRMLTNKEEMGRLVPSKVVAGNHIDSLAVAGKLQDSGVPVYYIDNSLGAGAAKLVDRAAIEAKANFPSQQVLIDKMNKVAQEYYKSGKITLTQLNDLIYSEAPKSGLKAVKAKLRVLPLSPEEKQKSKEAAQKMVQNLNSQQ